MSTTGDYTQILEEQAQLYVDNGYELKSITPTSAELIYNEKFLFWDWVILFLFPFGIIIEIVFALTRKKPCYFSILHGELHVSGYTSAAKEKGNPAKKVLGIIGLVVGIAVVIALIIILIVLPLIRYYVFNIPESEKVFRPPVSQTASPTDDISNQNNFEIEIENDGGLVIVSDYKNTDYRVAVIELRALGLQIEIELEENDSIQIGNVIRTEPVSGSELEIGSRIILYVCSDSVTTSPTEQAEEPLTIHIVKSGETLSSIARDYYESSTSPAGITLSDFIWLLKEVNTSEISVGQRLIIPNLEPLVSSTPTPD